METGFRVMDCFEDRKLKVVANKLKGFAAAYWEYLKNKRELDGKLLISSWEKMKSKFKAKFLPLDYEQRMYIHLQNCKQWNKTVEEYIDEFICLNSRNLLPDNENMQIARFNRGLKHKIQDQIKILNKFTLGQAFDLARKAEVPIRPPHVRARFTSQWFQTGPSKTTIPNELATKASGIKNRTKRATPQQQPKPLCKA
ncbi:hypothetical protein LWI28_008858 [Acer negundo]|uniref:Retrotransposon gag domain-containing protein n=1 Tax=Acer negundo TaxID=4023 RepID=A0AAD5NIZ9_ACENE|nr:hypothetical protein LWI28_008858 [Acer negundo]